MNLTYVPLLQLQHDFYTKPRGFERFREYISTMTNAETGDLELPLVAMNPMGKDHLLPFLERLLEMDVDDQGARATEEAAAQLSTIAGSFGWPMFNNMATPTPWVRCSSRKGMRWRRPGQPHRPLLRMILPIRRRYYNPIEP